MLTEAIKVIRATGALDYRTLLRDVTEGTTQDVVLTPINLAADSEFHAWEALSDEVLNNWERTRKQGDGT